MYLSLEDIVDRFDINYVCNFIKKNNKDSILKFINNYIIKTILTKNNKDFIYYCISRKKCSSKLKYELYELLISFNTNNYKISFIDVFLKEDRLLIDIFLRLGVSSEYLPDIDFLNLKLVYWNKTSNKTSNKTLKRLFKLKKYIINKQLLQQLEVYKILKKLPNEITLKINSFI